MKDLIFIPARARSKVVKNKTLQNYFVYESKE